MSTIRKTIIWLTIFSIAMGLFESAVVIYLREILYPEGFSFPLAPIKDNLVIIELLREASTLIMLFAIAYLSGKNLYQRLSYFVFCFAIWDIFYYVFLKVLIGWPKSLMTWDILFLIPVTWVGPVITPLIITVVMILFSSVLLYFDQQKQTIKISAAEWIMLILGSLVLIYSFTLDYSKFILEHYNFGKIWSVPTNDLYDLAMDYVPRKFYWGWYWLGILLLLSSIGLFIFRNIKNHKLK